MRSYQRCLILHLALFVLLAFTSDVRANGRTDLRFGSDGAPTTLTFGDDASNFIAVTSPGRGFFVRTFDGVSCQDLALDRVEQRASEWVVSARQGLPRFTFTVLIHPRYIILKLNRVEGLSAKSQGSLHFEINGSPGTKLRALALDCMTESESRDTQVTVHWNNLWQRNATLPLGAVAIYCAADDEHSDAALAAIWASGELPHPAIAGPWTEDRVKQWVADYARRFADMTTMYVAARNREELDKLTDFAQRAGVKVIYLHTDTWRGEYWPKENSHLHINEAVFPNGQADLADYARRLHERGMMLLLHYGCAAIGPHDRQRMGRPMERSLAGWGAGQLIDAVNEDEHTLRFRPAAGTELPFVPAKYRGGRPGTIREFFEPNWLRVEDELIRIGEFADVDKPVWTLRNCSRGQGAAGAAAHTAGADCAGLLAAYGQVFVPAADSPLLVSMARDYAAFANAIGLDCLEYDAYEIHLDKPWGSRRFSDAVAAALDHPVVSNTSHGLPVDANLEVQFSSVKRLKQFGYQSVNLSIQLDSHRPATSPLDAAFELPAGLAMGARRFVLLKPEPMFGISSETLRTYGLLPESMQAFALWRKAAKLMTDSQLRSITKDMVPAVTRVNAGGNHMQGAFHFPIREVDGSIEIIPSKVMTRHSGDVQWLVGQEFGAVGPRQIGQPGDVFDLENVFDPQPPAFIIRVLAETADATSMKEAASPDADALVESYRKGADGADAKHPSVVDSQSAALPQATLLQPQAKDINDQRLARFAQDGEGLKITADNPRDAPQWNTEGLPSWSTGVSFTQGRGIALELTGDGSGALLLLQLNGRGIRDYVVKVDFTGKRTIIIPHGEAAWYDADWGWRFDAKHFDYREIRQISLGFGFIPARTSPIVRIERLRALADRPCRLIDPIISIGQGNLAVQGDVPTSCYLRYEGGDTATVYDRNWNKLRDLAVKCTHFEMPRGVSPVRVDVAPGAPRPWLELQFITSGKPIKIGADKP